MEKRKRRSFTPEYRAEVVNLIREGDKSTPRRYCVMFFANCPFSQLCGHWDERG